MTQSTSRVHSVATAIGLTYGSTIIGAVVVLVATHGPSRIRNRRHVSAIVASLVDYGLIARSNIRGTRCLYLKIRDFDLDFIPFTIPDKRDIAVIIAGILALLGLLFVASTVVSSLRLESAQNQIVTIGQQNPECFCCLSLFRFC